MAARKSKPKPKPEPTPNERAEACGVEVQAVLERHGCFLVSADPMIVRGQVVSGPPLIVWRAPESSTHPQRPAEAI